MDFLIKKWSEKPINRSKIVKTKVPVEERSLPGQNTLKEKQQEEQSLNSLANLPLADNIEALELNTVKNETLLTNNVNKHNSVDRLNMQYITNYTESLLELIDGIEKLHCPTSIGKNTVIGRGNFQSPILFIGEAPGEEENKQQMPFVGASGKLLDKMLTSIGVDSKKIYISNMFFWQPDNNRTPNNSEIELTMPYVQKHIEIQQPKLIVTLGAVATKSLLKSDKLISSLRGTFQNLTFNNNSYYHLFVTFHPAYILRNHQYDKYEDDFKRIKTFLEENQLYDMVKIDGK